jgi:hypothetical protein
MLLNIYIETVYVPSRIMISGSYQATLYAVAEQFSAFLGRPARLGDLTERNVCGYLSAVARTHRATSVNSYRRRLLSLWEDAADRMLVARPGRRLIRTLPEEIDLPEAWTATQVSDLMAEAQNQRGMVGGVVASAWWLSLFLVIYWTSSRISSTLAVPTTCYDGHSILVRRQKNHRPQWHRLPRSCCDVIDLTHPNDRRLVWEHPWHPRTMWTKARLIIEAAGLPAPRTGRQLFHRLRRTTITLCASVDPALARQTAGHRDYATTLRHYVDPRLLSGRTAADVLPDPLDETLTPMTPRLHLFG